MNKHHVAVICFVGWILAVNPVTASPVDLSAPNTTLGASNARGFLELWREINGVGIELGKGSYLPLRYRFSTESDRVGALGAGFYVPMFEAKNVLIREDTMLANLPCGKKLYLWRDAVDPSKFQTPDKEWSGNLNGEDFTVWRGDGWKLLYRQGRLISSTSDDNRTFHWTYDNAGGASVDQNDTPLLTMKPGPGGQIAGFEFGGQSYNVEYGKRPITEVVDGQTILKDVEQALTKFEFPNGKVQTFEFGLDDNRVPKATAKDVDGKSTEYTWNPANRHLTTEKGLAGNWVYTVGDLLSKYGTPALSRERNDGKVEGRTVDAEKGIYTIKGSDYLPVAFC